MFSIIGEMQIKTTIRYCFLPIQTVIINNEQKSVDIGVENSDVLLVGISNDTAAVKNILVLPPKVQSRITMWSSHFTPKYIPQRIESKDSKQIGAHQCS